MTRRTLWLMLAVAAAATAQQVPSIQSRAHAFLGTLDSSARRKTTQAFNTGDRSNWGYTPRARRGLPTGEMTATQRSAADAVIRESLSPHGFAKVDGVIELEPILGALERSGKFRDPDRYYFSIFGDPLGSSWGWRFEGHHLSLNFTFVGRETSATPAFFGANPARVPSGIRAGWRVLAEEEDLGRRLVTMLSSDQLRRATIAARAPTDIVTGNDRRVSLDKFEGLPASAMNADQRGQLMRLINTYVGNANAAIAAGEVEKITRAGSGRLHFGWAGGTEPGQPHYYRIHGPTILIEYDNTQNNGNHIHSVWRSPENDFGEDLLRKHYAEAAHHRP